MPRAGQSGTFPLQSALDRYSTPGLIAVAIVFGTGIALDDAPPATSPVLYLTIPLTVVAILWLLLTSPHYGDLTVSTTEIRVVGLFGLVWVIERRRVAKIVRATIIYPGRYSTHATKKLLLVGLEGRCQMLLSNSYKVSALAGAIGVPVEDVRTPMRPAAANKRYPGAVNLAARFGPVVTAVVVMIGVNLLVLLYQRITRR